MAPTLLDRFLGRLRRLITADPSTAAVAPPPLANNSKEKSKTAPQSDRWYNLTLGPSFKAESSNKYCTLRYEFKLALIDKKKPGSLRKTKENRVNVEFHNNQLGKPKVNFEGSSEDYKETDVVLFIDGVNCRLERLHWVMKQLRQLRQSGESAAAASSAAAAVYSGPAMEPRLCLAASAVKPMHVGRNTLPSMPHSLNCEDLKNEVTG